MCSKESNKKIEKLTKDIEKQSGIVQDISSQVKKHGSVKLGVNDEWKIFERTANLKKFIDEEITLLDLRLKRMEVKAND